MLRLLAVGCLLLTTACASITQGTTQSIAVVTDPPGATCTLHRNGEQIGMVNPTPGSVTVGKSSRAIDVRCNREGFNPNLTNVPSSMNAVTAGNIIAGGLIGLAIDAGSGAMHQYPPNVSMSLSRLTADSQAPPLIQPIAVTIPNQP